jgi:hypothetical protein
MKNPFVNRGIRKQPTWHPENAEIDGKKDAMT